MNQKGTLLSETEGQFELACLFWPFSATSEVILIKS